MLPKRRRRLRAQPLIHLVPNIFTVLSLCAGLTSIRYALDHRFELAVVLIIVAGVFDGLDGRSARLLKITSKLGAELEFAGRFPELRRRAGDAGLSLVAEPGEGGRLGARAAVRDLLRAPARPLQHRARGTRPAGLDVALLHRHAGAGRRRLRDHPAADGVRLQGRLAPGLAPQRRRHGVRGADDGEPDPDLLDQDRAGPGQAGMGPADPDLRRHVRGRPVQRALVHAARGRASSTLRACRSAGGRPGSSAARSGRPRRPGRAPPRRARPGSSTSAGAAPTLARPSPARPDPTRARPAGDAGRAAAPADRPAARAPGPAARGSRPLGQRRDLAGLRARPRRDRRDRARSLRLGPHSAPPQPRCSTAWMVPSPASAASPTSAASSTSCSTSSSIRACRWRSRSPTRSPTACPRRS